MKKRAFKILAFLFVAFCVVFFGIFFSFNPKGDPFESRYSKTLLDRNGEILSIFLNDDEQWHLKSPQIRPNLHNNPSTNPQNTADSAHKQNPNKLKIATLLFEDKNFYSHFGFDFRAILRSVYINFSSDKRVGGSTITMQTIKLLRGDKRTYLNKMREIILSMRLEALYTKDEILEMYLNNAPYGGNIVGASTASLMYFNKNVENLTWAQASLLAVLPNAPGLIHLDKNSQILLNKRNILLRKLHEKGYIDSDNLTLSLKEPLPKITRPKNLAPHLAHRFATKNPNALTHSTIDKALQNKLESRLKSYHKKLLNLGIQNVAGIIVDTKSSEVLAYGGSQDFFDIEGLGQIDGIVAKRSPGSTLKPLLYALAIDDGLITEESRLIDAPTYFSNFKPQNASKKYFGLVSARDSLIKSLNVPFVGLLQDYGYDRFFFNLKEILGFSESNFEHYGLSLALGTKEMSIEDMAKIYIGLGNLGEFGEIYYLRDSANSGVSAAFGTQDSTSQDSTNHTKPPKKRLISKGASYLTLDAMRHLERVGLDSYFSNEKIFSWKTGTSYGRKDAWAAGTSPHYTIIVWAGNFTGEANPNLFGVNVAGALLFEILGDLGDLGGEFAKPDDLKEIKIDAPTGYRYSDDYVNIAHSTTLYPKSAKPLRYSPYLKNIFANAVGAELNSLDSDFANATKSTKLELPASLLAYYKEQNASFTRKERKIRILYPKNNLTIIRTRDFNGDNELIARIANISGESVFWYLNGELVGVGSETTRHLKLDSSTHRLTIINQSGESHSVAFRVAK